MPWIIGGVLLNRLPHLVEGIRVSSARRNRKRGPIRAALFTYAIIIFMKQSAWYRAIFTDKGIMHKQVFSGGSRKANHKVAMFFLPLVIVLVVAGIGIFTYGTFQSIYQAYRCDKRGMIWYATPPIYSRSNSSLGYRMKQKQLEPVRTGIYANWYQEKYIYGYCVSPNAPL